MAVDVTDSPDGAGAPGARHPSPFNSAWLFAPWFSFRSCARPSLLLEQRAGLELAELFASPVYYGVGVPRGSGAHVLLIPGFMGSDSYMTILDGWLRRVGYRPHRSGICLNAGRPSTLFAHVQRRVEEVAAEAGGRIVVIGHSLGGVFGRGLARTRPDLVSHVITLGSPYGNNPRQAGHPLVRAMTEMLLREGPRPDDTPERWLEQAQITGPLPESVRLTSLYSRDDAVVHWRACIDPDPRAASHEVRGSHVGLAWNARVYRHLGHALLQAA